MKNTMNGITLQALRSLLFLSVPEAARMIGNCQERTWRYWEADRGAAPDDVSYTIRRLSDFRTKLIAQTSAQISLMKSDHGEPDSIRLTYYSTLDDWMTQYGADPVYWRPHCAAMAEIALDKNVQLIKFDSAAYSKWLAGRNDNQAMRGEWAAIAE